MAEVANVFIMVHGMRTELEPLSPFPQYDQFWRDLCQAQPQLPKVINKLVKVQWGHATSVRPPNIRPDEELTEVQKLIGEKVSYEAVRNLKDPNNDLMSGFPGVQADFPLSSTLRKLAIFLRDNIILRGFGDAIYYTSEDGERQVRQVVYQQILEKIDPFEVHPEVRLHLFGHSLGVTLTHDFLFGLFNPDPNYRPGFVQQGAPHTVALFQKWRLKAQQGQLRLGSLTSAASQLPLFIMRKQALIDRLYHGNLIDPADIGILDPARTRWLTFYDVDDIVGFPTRNLYSPNTAIKEIQVATGDLPEDAHGKYWVNKRVIEETADLIYNNAI